MFCTIVSKNAGASRCDMSSTIQKRKDWFSAVILILILRQIDERSWADTSRTFIHFRVISTFFDALCTPIFWDYSEYYIFSPGHLLLFSNICAQAKRRSTVWNRLCRCLSLAVTSFTPAVEPRTSHTLLWHCSSPVILMSAAHRPSSTPETSSKGEITRP